MPAVPRLGYPHLEEAGGGAVTSPLPSHCIFCLCIVLTGLSLVPVSLSVCIHLPSETSLGEDMEELASGISQLGSIKGNRASIVWCCWRMWEARGRCVHGGVSFLSHVKNVWLIFFSHLEFSWQWLRNLAFVYFSMFPVCSLDLDC